MPASKSENPSKDRKKEMPDNASRRGAVDMGMPLMILAFIVMGGFIYWLSGQADAERASRVVEEEAPAEDMNTGAADLNVDPHAEIVGE